MISTHILDTSKGTPVKDVSVILYKKESSSAKWKKIETGITNADGRISFNCPPKKGVYRLNFEIEAYFKSDFFFLEAPVIFKISNTSRNYHVPLLLSPYGYTTYRGS